MKLRILTPGTFRLLLLLLFFHELPELMVIKEMPLLIIGLRLNDFLFVHEIQDILS